MPLYFRTLELDCPFSVWKVLHDYTTDAQLLMDRNPVSTMLMRAGANNTLQSFGEKNLRFST